MILRTFSQESFANDALNGFWVSNFSMTNGQFSRQTNGIVVSHLLDHGLVTKNLAFAYTVSWYLYIRKNYKTVLNLVLSLVTWKNKLPKLDKNKEFPLLKTTSLNREPWKHLHLSSHKGFTKLWQDHRIIERPCQPSKTNIKTHKMSFSHISLHLVHMLCWFVGLAAWSQNVTLFHHVLP